MTSTVADRIADFNKGFAEQVPARLGEVFASEQQGLVAAGVPAGAVQAGATLPDAELLDPTGAPVTLSATLAGRPAVVVFYRGAWCPYCNVTLAAYQEQLLPALTAQGVQLVAISPQTPDGSAAAVEKGALTFTVLSDPSNVLADTLGLVTEPTPEARAAQGELGFDVADSNADATARIPMPTVLVVDADGLVQFADVHPDYTTRTEPQTILAEVAQLG